MQKKQNRPVIVNAQLPKAALENYVFHCDVFLLLICKAIKASWKWETDL